MDKVEYFIKALASGAWKHREWIFSTFTIAHLNALGFKRKVYPYQLVVQDGTYYFYDPERNMELTELAPYGTVDPLFPHDELLIAPAGCIANLQEDKKTTYGNLLFNAVALAHPFGAEIKYVNKFIAPKAIQNLFLEKIIEDPEDGVIPPGKVTVSQVHTHQNAMYNIIGNLSLICLQSTSRRMYIVDKSIIALRDKLLKEHENQLSDLSVVADIVKQLVTALRESYKNDPASGFLILDKHFETILMRTQVMHGVEHSFNNDGSFALIIKSLSEGWDLDYFTELNNSARMGSFNRGANTALGGEAVKFFYRRYQNSRLVDKDCGSKVTITKVVTKFNVARIIGNYYVEDGAMVKITRETAPSLLGRTIEFRDPTGCQAGGMDYCVYCLGENFKNNPTAIPNIMAEVPSQWMYIFMKKMHGESLSNVEFDFNKHMAIGGQ